MIRKITNIEILDKILCKLIGLFLMFKCNCMYMFIKPPIILDSEETIDIIIQKKVSISRFGDGEFELIKNKDIKFQNASKLLSNRLIEVLKSNSDNLLIGLPKVFNKGDLLNKTRSEKVFWKESVGLYKSMIYRYIQLDEVYCNSFFTRPYIAYKNKLNCKEYFKKIKKIWDNQDILIVEGVYSRLGIGNDLFDNCNSLKRILAPAENAFDKYDEIFNEVIKFSKTHLILLALGPTATILAYDLSKNGYHAIDIGHIDLEYEWFLQGVSEKVSVKNKYTNEVRDGDKVAKLNERLDKEYKKEIIKEII